MTLLPDVLLTNTPPKDIIIGQALPFPINLGSTAEGCGVEVSEDFEGNLTGKDGEGVDPDEMC